MNCQRKINIVVQHFNGTQCIIKGVSSYSRRLNKNHEEEFHIRDSQFKHRRFIVRKVKGFVIG